MTFNTDMDDHHICSENTTSESEKQTPSLFFSNLSERFGETKFLLTKLFQILNISQYLQHAATMCALTQAPITCNFKERSEDPDTTKN